MVAGVGVDITLWSGALLGTMCSFSFRRYGACEYKTATVQR